MKRHHIALAIVLVIGIPWVVRADEKATAASQKHIKLDVFNVDGTVQRPQAFYVLPRSPLNYQSADPPMSFLPKIKKSLQKDPF